MDWRDDDPVDTLDVFAGMGLRLAVDDFGRDLTRLRRLAGLPVREVKISGSYLDSFAETTGPDSLDEHIVSSIVASAGLLGLSVIARDVGTEQQAKRLRKAGVKAVQGAYAGERVSAMEIEEMLAEGNYVAS